SLLRALDPDAIAAEATGKPRAEAQEVDRVELDAAKKQLIARACAPFDAPALRDALAKAKLDAEQTIDTVTADRVLSQGCDGGAKEKASNLVRSSREYIDAHRAEITALQILYSRPYRQRLTKPLLKELEKKLRDENAAWNEGTLWRAFESTAPGRVR